jgi:hypothetical protein
MNWQDYDPAFPADDTRLTWRTILAAVLVSIPLWALLILIGWALANLRFS